MTEPLTRLLHDSAADLPVPAPPARVVLAEGRRLRRRRRMALAGGVASLAVVAVLGATLIVPGADDGDRGVDTAAPTAPPPEPTFDGVTFAVGNEVYLDGGDEVVEIDDRAVKSLYYSSAGVIVRHGDNSFSDGGGPQRFTLIRPDGTTSPISVETEENAHGVDSGEPYLAWTEAVSGGVEVVVHDVDTDTEVARVPVDGAFSWSPPPVALAGDTVYVGGRSGRDVGLLAVDWRDGSVSETDIASSFPDLSGGRTAVPEPGADTVVDVASEEVLTRVPRTVADGSYSLRLSPSGRYAVTTTPDTRGPGGGPLVIDVDSGAEVELDEAVVAGQGWSQLDQPFAVADGLVTVCDPVDGACSSRPVDVDDDDYPALGGRLDES